MARWAHRRIPLGHPGYSLRPIVVGFEQVPRITDPARAREAPQLAVLSALAHRDLETARAARAGLDVLPEDDQKLYWDVILDGLPALVQQSVEELMMKGYQYKSYVCRYILAQGREEEREEARREIVALVGARLPAVREELERRLRDQPGATLVRIALELGQARDEGAVRAVLDRVLAPRSEPRAVEPSPVEAPRRRRRREVRPARPH